MIYYVAFYTPEEERENRISNYACEDKVDYICDVLGSLGENVTILSNAKSVKKIQKRKVIIKNDNKKIVLFSCLPKTNIFVHAIDAFWGCLQLWAYLLFHVKKDDIVIVYHSLGYRRLIDFARVLNRFKYILEVEELYQYIDEANNYKKKEGNIFKKPNGFIFSNDIIKERINKHNKPSVVINGIYKNSPRLFDGPLNTKDCIRVVYAGSLSKQKGVDYVIKSAEFLGEEFEIRIIGFGTDNDLSRIREVIDSTRKKTKASLSYDGVLKGNEYNGYLQKCRIGVCIQDPSDEFNLYEFPSKIFSYLSNGLSVVVNRLQQIERSQIRSFVTVSEDTSPQSIADAIKRACLNTPKNNTILDSLNDRFSRELGLLLKGGKQL